MGRAQVGGHLLRVVELGDGRRKMRLAGQEDVLGTAGQIGLVLLGQPGNREGVPAEGGGVAKIGLEFATNGGDPDEMQARSNKSHAPKGSIGTTVSRM